MRSSRRDFLRSLGIGVASGSAVRWPLKVTPGAYASARAPRLDGFIRLDSNENAYGPSAKVAEAIRSATNMVNRYPFRKYDGITEQIASLHQVEPKQILFACGSTEILRLAACAFLGNGRQLVQPVPTFEAIEDYAKAVGSDVISVPLDASFAHDLDGMLARVRSSTGLTYICNPNNPTGTITPRKAIESFIGKLPLTTTVVIDEAYHHYAVKSEMYASFIDQPLTDDRVIVTRTFSKVYGLAGLRLGYAVASPKMIERLKNFITQDSLNAVMAEIVGIAINDVEGIGDFVKRNMDDRQEFVNSGQIRMLMPISSQTNFVLMNTQHPATEVIEHFRKHNILIGRRFPLLDTYIRVSLGTPEQMRTFWRAWDMLPWAKKFMHH